MIYFSHILVSSQQITCFSKHGKISVAVCEFYNYSKKKWNKNEHTPLHAIENYAVRTTHASKLLRRIMTCEARTPAFFFLTRPDGAYLHKGCPKRFYFVEYENGTIKSCATAHSENGVYYVNDRRGAKYMKRTVQSCDVYELTRMYRQSKNNPKFMQTIASLRKADSSKPSQYYLLTYSWMDNEEHDGNDFIVPRRELKKKALSKIENGDSSAKVYRDLVIEAKVPSEEPRDPKYIHNIKAQFSQQNKVDPPVNVNQTNERQNNKHVKSDVTRSLHILQFHRANVTRFNQILCQRKQYFSCGYNIRIM
ncbi:uncharacterized protein LOC130629141 [Hydractinia symbiolongicarpus]|uniref:uncharacterized protein LOC130629141 n=1 Tax=Hydractinia symbiolongicarpus TaxID=13093 RepID=UPI0025507736|nr:uncharacterized protein LOC130629141 [Hydractinia symbiolongicarpus]XP_057298234.1 uncharacterized protein LOC130629141 [Hydractinia symbiolongicarpus]